MKKTEIFENILEDAKEYSLIFKDETIRPSHVLYAILKKDNAIFQVFYNMNINIDILTEKIKNVCDSNQQHTIYNHKELMAYAQNIATKEKKDLDIIHYMNVIFNYKNELTDIISKNINVELFFETYEKNNYHIIDFDIHLDYTVDEYTSAYDKNLKSATINTKNKIIESYSTNLTELAKQDKLFPLIGRNDILNQIQIILNKQKKSNLILTGKAGVGKTQIVEGLAQKFVKTNSKWQIISLDINSIVAGTRFRGEFEQRMNNILKEIEKNDNWVIFIDEIHTIVNAGDSEGGLNFSNIIKPFLTKSNIKFIGATTTEEYEKYFKNDNAINRRFERVLVDEVSQKDCLTILKQIVPKYVKDTNLVFSDKNLETIVNLIDKFSTKVLPDGAIDLLDEFISHKNFNNPITELLKENKFDEIEKLNHTKSNTTINVDCDEILSFFNTKYKILNINTLYKNYTNIKNNLNSKIINQQWQIDTLLKNILVNYSNLKRQKPIGVYLFVGDTGVGKTQLAKELSNEFFNGSYTKIDMGEIKEKIDISNLIGASAGYVGYERGGKLTEPIKNNPFQVIILDEIEKAHPNVYDVLLNVFDTGKLVDSKHQTVNFNNTVIIMTSNIGTSFNKSTIGFSENKNENTEHLLKKVFKKEFISRINEIIYFNNLTNSSYSSIFDKLIIELQERYGTILSYTDEMKNNIINKAFNEKLGVRNLEKIIINKLVTPNLLSKIT